MFKNNFIAFFSLALKLAFIFTFKIMLLSVLCRYKLYILILNARQGTPIFYLFIYLLRDECLLNLNGLTFLYTLPMKRAEENIATTDGNQKTNVCGM
jgi:hypothetical protein